MSYIDKKFVDDTEKSFFRTTEDTGANLNAIFIWNLVRKHIGLPPITLEDLPSHCSVHGKYHVIREDYGCKRTRSVLQ